MLSSFSREFFKAGNGYEAVEICRQHPDIDLVLMDIKMPKMDGYEAVQHIRKFNKKLVIIFQSAFKLVSKGSPKEMLGYNDYIAKPVSPYELEKVISKYFS